MENKYAIKSWLWDFAEETVKLFKMDDSHGIVHFVNVYLYAAIILDDYKTTPVLPGMNMSKADEEDLIKDAAFAHDLIDRKYMKEDVGTDRVRSVFCKNGYSYEKVDILLRIISATSFSKRVERRRKSLDMIEPGPLALATAIVTDADQLDAFNPERVRIYHETKLAGSTDPKRILAARTWQKTIFVKRVLQYRDVYMNTSIAKKIAAPLHNNVEIYVAREYSDIDELYDYP